MDALERFGLYADLILSTTPRPSESDRRFERMASTMIASIMERLDGDLPSPCRLREVFDDEERVETLLKFSDARGGDLLTLPLREYQSIYMIAELALDRFIDLTNGWRTA